MTTLMLYLSERLGSNVEPADVLSKLSSLDKQIDNNKTTNTVCFGLEDSSGNIVKVYVNQDQAESFENALSMELDQNDEQNSQEIAELLYRLHDRFDITDVNWPNIEEDEEDDETGASDFEDQDDANNMGQDPTNLDDAEGDFNDTGDMGNMGSTGDNATGALDSVLQALIANAEADRQEALAKAAEARAREAEAAARMADQKLKAEEEIADMEAYHNAQQEEKKESKKLAKLAKYRHTMKQKDDHTGPFNGPGEALSDQQRDSEERMTMPSGENPPGTDPSQSPNNADVQAEIDDVGFENEERLRRQKPTRMDVNKRFKDLKSAVKFLHSLKVRRAVHND